MLPSAAGAAHDAAARLDSLDDPLAFPSGPKPHDVAGCHDMPLIGGEGFKKPSRGAVERLAGFIADKTQQTLHTEHTAQAAYVAVDFGQYKSAGVVLDDFASHGPFSRDVPLAADAFALRR